LEHALGQTDELDGQTDLWAVGATMFTLLSGRHVHLGDNQSQIWVAAGSRPAPSLLSVAPDAPPSIAAVIDRALSFRKADRWPDAGAMRDALARAYEVAFGEALSTAPLRALFSGSEHASHSTSTSKSSGGAPVRQMGTMTAPKSTLLAPSVAAGPSSEPGAGDASAPRRTGPPGASTTGATSASRADQAGEKKTRWGGAAPGLVAGLLALGGAGALVAIRTPHGAGAGTVADAGGTVAVHPSVVASVEPEASATPSATVTTSATATLDTPDALTQTTVDAAVGGQIQGHRSTGTQHPPGPVHPAGPYNPQAP
jgi:serine/threonine-protein kinase